MGSKQFTLIHDTLLEQYNKAEIIELGKKDESFNGGKSIIKERDGRKEKSILKELL